MKVKEESEKAGLKLNIQKTKIVASSLITSWLIDGEAVRGLQPKIKRRLLLGRKAMTNLDSILKSRDIHYFVNKGPSSQNHSYDFSSSHVWM